MICPMCETESETVERREQNTRYVKEEMNFVTSCKECFDEIQEFWKEQWEDYYANCM